jgi:hypothetical protein
MHDGGVRDQASGYLKQRVPATVESKIIDCGMPSAATWRVAGHRERRSARSSMGALLLGFESLPELCA